MANKNNVYIGNRYVPVFADPVEWDNLRIYEPLTIVTYQGTSYTSKKAVPAGIALSNTEYWVATGNYNAQVEAYRQEVAAFTTEFNGKINNVEADIDEITPQVEEFAKKFFYKVVSPDGNHDYTSIQAALNDNTPVARLLIMPGTYYEKIDFNHHKFVSLVGVDKANTIITYDGALYKNPTILCNINFEIRNLTVEAVGKASFTPTFNNADLDNTFPAYAIHCDQGTGDTVNNSIIDNCIIRSSAGPAIGNGVQVNEHLTISNCTITRTPINNSYKANNGLHDGAGLFHCSVTANGEHSLALINNNIVCSYRPSAIVRCEGLTGASGFTLTAINNKTNKGVNYLKGTSALSEYSTGNNNARLNSDYDMYVIPANLTLNGTTNIAIPDDCDLTDYKTMKVLIRDKNSFTESGNVSIPIASILYTLDKGFSVSYSGKLRNDTPFGVGIEDLNHIKIATYTDNPTYAGSCNIFLYR